MAASINDKFLKVGVAGTLTSLSAPGHSIAGTTITVGSTTNWPTDTAVIFGIRQVDSGGELVAGTYTEWRGVVSGSTLTSMVLMYGSDQIYPAGSTTQVFIPLSAARDNRLVDGILVEHNQDGTHSDITADTLALTGALTGTTATFDSVTISGTATSQGWTALGDVPDTVTPSATAPRVYDLVFNGEDHTDTLSPNMKLQLTRTVAAPNQCTDLEASSSQYFSKSSPSGMTFTDDFVASAWIKLESYPGSDMSVVSRYNGTSGWELRVDVNGRVHLLGFNGGSSNYSQVQSYASIPLNKWVHVAAQLDMSTYTATTTTSYVMIDGIDVPALVSRGGTNPTALIQAGNLEVGGRNGGLTPFDGKLAQVAIYSAKVTQATILASINRTLLGSETSLVSAYSFNNTINDLSANANNLTANNSAVATNADSPFGNGGVSTTLEYAIVLGVSFSTNTTVTVQLPAGCQLPSTGGISTVLYSTHKTPFNWPIQTNRWTVSSLLVASLSQASPVSNTYYNIGGQITLPAGVWDLGYFAQVYIDLTGSGDRTVKTVLSTTNNGAIGEFSQQAPSSRVANLNANIFISAPHKVNKIIELSTTTTFYLNVASISANATTVIVENADIVAVPVGV